MNTTAATAKDPAPGSSLGFWRRCWRRGRRGGFTSIRSRCCSAVSCSTVSGLCCFRSSGAVSIMIAARVRKLHPPLYKARSSVTYGSAPALNHNGKDKKSTTPVSIGLSHHDPLHLVEAHLVAESQGPPLLRWLPISPSARPQESKRP
jgi:hypothetical protein